MKTEPDIARYCALMEIVKKRIEVVLFLEQRKGSVLYLPSTIESVYLQFRKILELISMASLVANKEVYSREFENFANHWNARRMLESLERLNPDFYPNPFVEDDRDLVDKTDGYLTKEDFITLYSACGAIMHTENPYGTRIDYDDYLSKMIGWREAIIGLLNNHIIRLLDNPKMYVIHLQEAKDDKVHGYTFAPAPPDKQSDI